MANRDFEMGLRMDADFGRAQRALKDTERDIQRIAQATAEANAEMAEGAAGGSGSGGASPEALDAIRNVTEALDRNAQARESVQQASRLTQEAVAAEIGAITDLQTRLAAGARDMDQLADTEARLDAAMSKGLITAEEYDEALGKLNEEQARLEREATKSGKAIDAAVGRYDKASAGLKRLEADEKRLKAAVDAGRISREQYNRAMAGISTERAKLTALRDGANNAAGAMRTLNVQSMAVQRNLSQLVTYGVTGNWRLAGAQIVQLGNQAGVAGRLFSAAGLSLGAMGAVAGVVAFQFAKGYLELRAYEKALISTGNSAGVTSHQVVALGDEIGRSTGRYGDSEKALKLLITSGKAVGDVLEETARAAVNLSELTGRSIEDTVRDVQALAKSPTAGLQELNERYHFLTLEVYENVRSLEEQGRTQDAVKLATEELDRVTSQRVENMRASLGTLERKWDDVRAALGRYLNALRSIGSADFDLGLAQIELERSQQVLDNLRASGASAEKIAGMTRRVADAQVRLNELLGEEQQRRTDAAEQAEEAARQTAGLDAGNKLNAILKDGKSRAEQFSEAVKDLEGQFRAIREANPDDYRLADVIFGTDGLRGGAFDQAVAVLRERFKEPKGRKGPKPKDPNREAERELQNMQRQLAMLDALEDGQTRVTEAARIRYEIEEGAYKNASEAVKRQLIDYAQVLDFERDRTELAKELKSVDLEILRLQGQGAAASLQQALEKLQALRREAEKLGDSDAVARIEQAIGLTTMRAQLDELSRVYEQVMAEIQSATQRVQLEVQTGLVTEAEGQRRIIAVYREKGAVIEQLLPQMEAMALALGDPQALANVQRIRAELEQMQATTSLLQQQIGTTFQQSFASFLETLAAGTASLGDAVRGFLRDMAAGLARMAAAMLAQQAWAGLLKLFGKGGGTDIGEGAGKLQNAALATAAGGAAVGIGANRLSAAAKELATAATLMLAANAVGGFAEGGYTGAGGKYQLAGYVHRGEGVLNQDEIRALGGPGGFYALRSAIASGDVGRFAMAGLPNVSMPAVPRWSFAEGGFAAGELPTPQVNLRAINIVDPDLFDQFLDDPSTDRSFINKIGRNLNEIKALL